MWFFFVCVCKLSGPKHIQQNMGLLRYPQFPNAIIWWDPSSWCTQALPTAPAIRLVALSAVKHLTPMLKQQHEMLYIQWIWPYMYGNIYSVYLQSYILCLFMCQSIHISSLCSTLEQVCCQPWSHFPWESPTKLWGSSLSSLPFPPVELFSLQ